MDDKDLEKTLKDMGKDTANYPPELKSATRAEFTTLIRTTKKKQPGCPLIGSIILLLLFIAVRYLF